MNMKALVFIAFLAIAETACIGQSATSTNSLHYTRTQVRSMVQNAKTSADYLVLHDYYNHLAETNRLLADEERQEWDRRAANPTVYAKKYPAPVDSAHYLYDSYVQKTKASAEQAHRYEQLAHEAKASY
jgi:hypothetical protein